MGVPTQACSGHRAQSKPRCTIVPAQPEETPSSGFPPGRPLRPLGRRSCSFGGPGGTRLPAPSPHHRHAQAAAADPRACRSWPHPVRPRRRAAGNHPIVVAGQPPTGPANGSPKCFLRGRRRIRGWRSPTWHEGGRPLGTGGGDPGNAPRSGPAAGGPDSPVVVLNGDVPVRFTTISAADRPAPQGLTRR